MIQASGSIAALMRSARRSRTGCHSQGLWLTNCWEALLVAALEARRQRLDRLAAPVEHQAAQVGLTPAALVGSWQRGEHLRREGDQRAARPGKLCRLHELRVLGMVPPTTTMISSPGFAAAQRRPAQADGVILDAGASVGPWHRGSGLALGEGEQRALKGGRRDRSPSDAEREGERGKAEIGRLRPMAEDEPLEAVTNERLTQPAWAVTAIQGGEDVDRLPRPLDSGEDGGMSGVRDEARHKGGITERVGRSDTDEAPRPQDPKAFVKEPVGVVDMLKHVVDQAQVDCLAIKRPVLAVYSAKLVDAGV